jgi:type I restriction-modification system DNA methylase subunit
MPDRSVREAAHREIAKLHHENLLIFVDPRRTQSVWRWEKREDGKSSPREHAYMKGQPGDLFINKISAMVFDISQFEKGNPPIFQVAEALRSALDVEPVTKKFYAEFTAKRLKFTELIHGVTDPRDKKWYASILLNRLMFIYFLQKKFLLNKGDDRYLQNKLKECEDRFGCDNYYKCFLNPLFFEGFAKPQEKRSPENRELLGGIVYLNGGLFLPHKIEEKYPEIQISDRAFQNLFVLFESYSWNLDDTPGGRDDEINPDVLGYIFEKYINQKEFGAYYTRPAITEYLCERTIHQTILDKVNEAFGAPFYPSPRRCDTLSDLLLNLDADLCRRLFRDILPNLSILDPACGSGAFLVAAMKTLINIYSAVTGRIDYLSDSDLKTELQNIRGKHKSILYHIKQTSPLPRAGRLRALGGGAGAASEHRLQHPPRKLADRISARGAE